MIPARVISSTSKISVRILRSRYCNKLTVVMNGVDSADPKDLAQGQADDVPEQAAATGIDQEDDLPRVSSRREPRGYC